MSFIINWLDSWEDLTEDSFTSWFWSSESVPGGNEWWFKGHSSEEKPGAVIGAEHVAPELGKTSYIISKNEEPECIAEVQAASIRGVGLGGCHIILISY